MPHINDLDRNVFSNVEKTIADNFTADELHEIHEMAERLRQILAASIGRIDKPC
jgi:hypothetical protein